MTFDMDFDDPSMDHHDHKETLNGKLMIFFGEKDTRGSCLSHIDLAMRIHELNQRVQDIRREQQSQRVSHTPDDSWAGERKRLIHDSVGT